MDISPRVPPVGAHQRGRIWGCFPDGNTLQEGEQESQHSVPQAELLIDLHPATKLVRFLPLRGAAAAAAGRLQML